MLDDAGFASPAFLWLVRIVALVALGGALGGIAFIAAQATRRAPEGGGDRDWRFLFLCWSDAVAIVILYVSVDFSWMFEDLVRLLQSALMLDAGASGYFTSHYLVLVIQLVCYGLIMGIAIRLFLRIRRFLESG